jgi:hypothetical protein
LKGVKHESWASAGWGRGQEDILPLWPKIVSFWILLEKYHLFGVFSMIFALPGKSLQTPMYSGLTLPWLAKIESLFYNFREKFVYSWCFIGKKIMFWLPIDNFYKKISCRPNVCAQLLEIGDLILY